MDLSDQKRALRKIFKERRDAISGSIEKSQAACDLFLQKISVPPTGVISGYMPFGSEIDPRPILSALANSGLELALPVVVEKSSPLVFRQWTENTKLIPDAAGIAGPPEHSSTVSPTLLILPLLAFDRNGFRLGYGGGYYDRTLFALRKSHQIQAIGLAFAEQETDMIPKNETDARLDWVVTDREAIYTGGPQPSEPL